MGLASIFLAWLACHKIDTAEPAACTVLISCEDAKPHEHTVSVLPAAPTQHMQADALAASVHQMRALFSSQHRALTFGAASGGGSGQRGLFGGPQPSEQLQELPASAQLPVNALISHFMSFLTASGHFGMGAGISAGGAAGAAGGAGAAGQVANGAPPSMQDLLLQFSQYLSSAAASSAVSAGGAGAGGVFAISPTQPGAAGPFAAAGSLLAGITSPGVSAAGAGPGTAVGGGAAAAGGTGTTAAGAGYMSPHRAGAAGGTGPSTSVATTPLRSQGGPITIGSRLGLGLNATAPEWWQRALAAAAAGGNAAVEEAPAEGTAGTGGTSTGTATPTRGGAGAGSAPGGNPLLLPGPERTMQALAAHVRARHADLLAKVPEAEALLVEALAAAAELQAAHDSALLTAAVTGGGRVTPLKSPLPGAGASMGFHVGSSTSASKARRRLRTVVSVGCAPSSNAGGAVQGGPGGVLPGGIAGLLGQLEEAASGGTEEVDVPTLKEQFGFQPSGSVELTDADVVVAGGPEGSTAGLEAGGSQAGKAAKKKKSKKKGAAAPGGQEDSRPAGDQEAGAGAASTSAAASAAGSAGGAAAAGEEGQAAAGEGAEGQAQQETEEGPQGRGSRGGKEAAEGTAEEEREGEEEEDEEEDEGEEEEEEDDPLALSAEDYAAGERGATRSRAPSSCGPALRSLLPHMSLPKPIHTPTEVARKKHSYASSHALQRIRLAPSQR